MLSDGNLPMTNILDLPPPAPGTRLHYGAGELQFGELRVPPGTGPFPVVVNIHGGFWRAQYDLCHASHLCAALTGAGCSTWNVEYRRVGHSGGGWPGAFDDVVGAFQFLPELAGKFPLDLRRVVVMGHSAGGQLALCLAAREPSLRGAIALAPVSDLLRAHELRLGAGAVENFLGAPPEPPAENWRAASPLELSIRVPQRLIHAALDDVVPISLSRDYVAAKRARGENAQLIELAGADHFDVIDPRSKAWPVVQRTVLELLG
ncbi:MAG TPA: alpha/beta hydrolase [Terriglobales bacterium]|nr:alpha/beta hydrolase [Terriglobales bacterium]